MADSNDKKRTRVVVAADIARNLDEQIAADARRLVLANESKQLSEALKQCSIDKDGWMLGRKVIKSEQDQLTKDETLRDLASEALYKELDELK